MLNNEVIQALRQEAVSNKAANAMFHVFAMRKRTRNSISVVGLTHRMKEEGFEFSKDQYRHMLSFLGKLGFGTVETTRRGDIKALSNIGVTLQSIGLAACGQQQTFKTFKPRTKYTNLTPPKTSTGPELLGAKEVALVVNLNGKILNINIPSSFDSQDISNIVERFHDKTG